MVTKSGQYKAKIPTQYKSKKKKVLAREGDKYNLSINKCIICGKKMMEKYQIQDPDKKYPEKEMITIIKCKHCKYMNVSSLVYKNENDNEPIQIHWYKPAGALQDKK